MGKKKKRKNKKKKKKDLPSHGLEPKTMSPTLYQLSYCGIHVELVF